MFAKLLKYDLRAVFKHWWIAAAASVLIAAIGGVCISIVNVNYTSYGALQTVATLGLVLSIVGIILFYVLSELLVLIRYYKNFYSDEGYLTFTLPVSKSSLLNSKLLMSLIVFVVSTAVLLLDIGIMLIIGYADQIFKVYFWEQIFAVIADITKVLGGYTAVYIVEGLIALLTLWVFTALAIFICITVASMLVHKHKVFAAVGIYYVATGIISGLIEILILRFSFYHIIEKIVELERVPCLNSVTFLILGGIAVAGIASALLYMLHLWLLERKLNLE